MDVAHELFTAMEDAVLTSVRRELITTSWTNCRIVGLYPGLVLMACLDEGSHPDGYSVVRLKDVTKVVSPAPFSEFHEKALALRGESITPAPGVDLSSWESVVLSVAKSYPLMTIHQEVVDPGICWVGVPRRVVDGARVVLRYITPGAKWEDDDVVIGTDTITRVDFDGKYERALDLVSEAELDT